jgi:outer membrane protein assembly factor BamD
MKLTKILSILILGSFLIGCADNPKSPIDAFKNQSEEKIYQDGQKSLAKKHYEDAIQHFEALDALYPFSKHSEQAQLNIIYAYYANDDLDSALVAADHYIHLYPTSKNADYAYYMRGIVNFEKNSTWVTKFYSKDPALVDTTSMQQAFVDFNNLISQYPNSKYAPDAKNRMIYIRNLLAAHELAVANFYFRHKAYVAAANRASYVVEHFKNVPESKEALKIMIKSYRALGADENANEAMRVLQLNYPGTKV